MSGEDHIAPGIDYKIVTATWRDLNALRHLEQVCFPQDSWPLWDLIGVLSIPNIIRFKAVITDQMVGFIAGDRMRSTALGWITTVGVLPKYRHQGIGRKLISACEEHLSVPTIRLSVRASNQNAILLYERLGYRRVGVWPHYYVGGEDASVMEKGVPIEDVMVP